MLSPTVALLRMPVVYGIQAVQTPFGFSVVLMHFALVSTLLVCLYPLKPIERTLSERALAFSHVVMGHPLAVVKASEGCVYQSISVCAMLLCSACALLVCSFCAYNNRCAHLTTGVQLLLCLCKGSVKSFRGRKMYSL